MATADLAQAFEKIKSHAQAIAAGKGKPYEEGWEIWSTAMSIVGQSEEASALWALWALWGGLTDWVEVKPQETAEAENAMVEAAKQWLALSEDQAAREQYYEHWLYEVVGYERPTE